ncbi:hypothetical protein Vadar_006043 [Vaccinium darrowii]|uniref:Uncharacterized protein n=1 Tax=Vaccinium darrowii TaxID=229202 RepID=A0ACB7YJQ2_9ERIC|nr:hypothetical protein Vadar_006043 [Vaccinium darrowii]
MMLYAVVLDPRCKVGFFKYCFLNTLGYDKKLVSEMTDKITCGITELFQWYVKNNASEDVHSREEVGGASSKVAVDGDDDFDSHKSLKSLSKMHQQNETNMASKTELEKYLMEASEDDNPMEEILSKIAPKDKEKSSRQTSKATTTSTATTTKKKEVNTASTVTGQKRKGLESSMSDTALDKALEKKTRMAHERSRTTLMIQAYTISTRTRSKSLEDKKFSPEDLASTPKSIDKPLVPLPCRRKHLKKQQVAETEASSKTPEKSSPSPIILDSPEVKQTKERLSPVEEPFVDSSPSREVTDSPSDHTPGKSTLSDLKIKAKESLGTEKGAFDSPVSPSKGTIKDEDQGHLQIDIQAALSPLENLRARKLSGVGFSIQPSISSDDVSKAKESLKAALRKNLRSALHHGRASQLKEIMKTLIEAKALAPDQEANIVSFYKQFPSLLDAFDNAKHGLSGIEVKLEKASSLTKTLNQRTEDWKVLKVRLEEGVQAREVAKKRIDELKLQLEAAEKDFSQAESNVRSLQAEKNEIFDEVNRSKDQYQALNVGQLNQSKIEYDSKMQALEMLWEKFKGNLYDCL